MFPFCALKFSSSRRVWDHGLRTHLQTPSWQAGGGLVQPREARSNPCLLSLDPEPTTITGHRPIAVQHGHVLLFKHPSHSQTIQVRVHPRLPYVGRRASSSLSIECASWVLSTILFYSLGPQCCFCVWPQCRLSVVQTPSEYIFLMGFTVTWDTWNMALKESSRVITLIVRKPVLRPQASGSTPCCVPAQLWTLVRV